MALVAADAGRLAALISGGGSSVRFALHFHGISSFSHWRSGPRNVATHILNFVTRGEGHVAFRGRTVPFRAGAVIWMSPGSEHEIVFDPAERHFMKFSVQAGGRRYRLSEDVIVVDDAWELLYFSEQILWELNQELPFRSLRCRAMLTMLLTSMQRHRRPRPRGGYLLNRAQQRRITRYVEANVHEGLTAADLARALGLSHDYFSRVFKHTYGIPPREWLLRERMRLAVTRMTTTNETLQEIAFGLGYNYPYLFSRQFKKVFGISPRTYRRQHAELAR